MTLKAGINGFGRIGRLHLRAVAKQHANLDVVTVNDSMDGPTMRHLFSVHGTFPGEVAFAGDSLVIEDKAVTVLSEAEPARLLWRDMGVDVVIESTGRFTKCEADARLTAGARKVIISAPAGDADVMVVLGVNDAAYDKAMSSPTRVAGPAALAAMVKALDDLTQRLP